MRVIGITGGVGSGKSELLRYIGDHYRCRIMLADEVSHDVMKKGGAAYEALLQLLEQYPGDGKLIREDGEICRQEMAARIFTSLELREKVNGILHPAVRESILSAIQEEKEKALSRDTGAVDFFFLEAALLIECGYGSVVDEMWYIYCNLPVRRQRLRESRGYSDAKIDSILAAQLSEENFRKGADVVIDNSGTLEEAYRQIDEVL